MVERFDVAIKYPCGRDPYAVMVSDPEGSYVMAAHYDAARAEIERLEHLLDLSKKTTEAVLERAGKAEAERDSFQAMFRSCLKGNDALREKAQKANTERDEARAQVAAAFEAGAIKYVAGDTCEDEGCPHYGKKHTHPPGDLTPADAKAALEAYGREKEREGMQRAAGIAAFHVIYDDTPAHSVRDGIEAEILAKMEKLK